MVGAEFDLAGQIEQNIGIVPELEQPLFQPVKIGLQMLEAEQHATIWSESMLVHDVLQRDQLGNVDCAWVRQRIIRRVEVHDRYWTLQRRKQLVFTMAVRRLAAARRSHNHLSERHGESKARVARFSGRIAAAPHRGPSAVKITVYWWH